MLLMLSFCLLLAGLSKTIVSSGMTAPSKLLLLRDRNRTFFLTEDRGAGELTESTVPKRRSDLGNG